MRTSEERIAELHRRMGEMKLARNRRRYVMTCTLAGAVCLVLLVMMAAGISRLPVRENNFVYGGVTASIFGTHEALGYIAVAVVSLCLGVTVTVFCFRMKRKMDKEENSDK